MIYRFFRALASIALHLFFGALKSKPGTTRRRSGRSCLCPTTPMRSVDPLVLMTAIRREVTVTAKSVLGQNPLLRWLMSALGVVTFHRRSDVGKGADLRQNVRSLQLCREILRRWRRALHLPGGSQPFRSQPAQLSPRPGSDRAGLPAQGRQPRPAADRAGRIALHLQGPVPLRHLAAFWTADRCCPLGPRPSRCRPR